MSSNSLSTSLDRVLLTGGTSYLGCCLVNHLLRQGAEVHLVVRPGSDLSRLDGLTEKPVFHVHDGGTENLAAIMSVAAPQTVFHMATHYLRQHASEQISALITDNILFGTQLLEAMYGAGVTRLITLGTFFQFYNSDEYRPVNLYAATKKAFEDIVAYYRDAHGFRTATLILYDVYGPGDWRSKLMGTIRDAQANGSPLNLTEADTILDLVYVDDVVEALIHAAEEGIEGGPYAVSSAKRTTLEDLVKVFERVGGKPNTTHYGAYPKTPRTPNPPWRGPALPGWHAKVGLEEGVRRFLKGE